MSGGFSPIDAARAADALQAVFAGNNPDSAELGALGPLGPLMAFRKREAEQRAMDEQAKLDANVQMHALQLAAQGLHNQGQQQFGWQRLLAELAQKDWAMGQQREMKREEILGSKENHQITADAYKSRADTQASAALQRAQAANQARVKVTANDREVLALAQYLQKQNKDLTPPKAAAQAYEQVTRQRQQLAGINTLQGTQTLSQVPSATPTPQSQVQQPPDVNAWTPYSWPSSSNPDTRLASPSPWWNSFYKSGPADYGD